MRFELVDEGETSGETAVRSSGLLKDSPLKRIGEIITKETGLK